jgi:uncharacterized membrane protein/RNA polymerase subunit RPABC4/transcription elongation factor Spt4
MGSPSIKLNSVLVAWGIILILAGTAIALTNNFYRSETVKRIEIDEVSTDWYTTEYFYALRGDRLEVNVNVSGGSAKLRVDEQSGATIFQEVQGVIMLYSIPIASNGAYTVQIWTRAWPWPSTYVSLIGTVEFRRVSSNFYPMGYVAVGTAIAGLLLIVGSVLSYILETSRAKEIQKLRACPYCNRQVAVERSVCPHCGFDVNRSEHCKYCAGFFDRSLPKCPNCGAKKG